MTHSIQVDHSPLHQPNSRSAWIWAALLGIMLFGGLVRALPAVYEPVWADEVWTWWVAQPQAYWDMVRWETREPKHPPLSFIAVAASMDFFDSDEPWVLRLPAVIAGILCIPAAFVLGWVVHGRGAGLLAAAFVAVDPNMVDQGQQARMFGMLALLVLVALTLAVVMMRQPRRNPWGWVALGLVLGLQLWVNQLALAAWAAVGLAAVLVAAHQWWWRLPDAEPGLLLSRTAMALTVAAATAPLELIRLVFGVGEAMEPQSAPMTQVVVEVARSAYLLIHTGPLSLLVYPLAAAGLLLLLRRRLVSATLLLTTALMGMLIVIAIRQVHAFVNPRFFVVSQPAIWIGLAALPFLVHKRIARVLVVALVAVVLGAQVVQAVYLDHWTRVAANREPFGETVAELHPRVPEGHAMLFSPRGVAIFSLYHRTPTPPALTEALGETDPPEQILESLRQHPRPTGVVIVASHLYSPARLAQTRRHVRALAAWYRHDLDDARLKRHVKLHNSPIIWIDASGIRFEQPAHAQKEAPAEEDRAGA